jgi:hypothetical protein
VEIEGILKELEFQTGRFPRQALEAAIARREEIIPHLLEILEQATIHAEDFLGRKGYMAHIYAMFLLAQFREKRAYPLLVKLASLPGELPQDLTGDVVTEDLDKMLASVCCGDTSLIEGLIEDADINEYVRSAAVRALLTLAACGEVPRDEVVAYYKSLFEAKLERQPAVLWSSLVNCSVHLYPEELYDDIQQAFEEGLVGRFYVNEEDVERTLSLGKEPVLERLKQSRYHLIRDTIEQMESWACFEDRKTHTRRRQRATPKLPSTSHTRERSKPAVRVDRKPRRNDRCPCGSGKKYKKCCARKQQ